MKPKFIVKIIIDIFMSLVLLLLMAFQLTGQKAHEWLGAAMLILFLLHNFLNIRWYKNLFKGKYTIIRIIKTFVNIVMLIAMLGSMLSGIAMSRYTFGFIDLSFSAVFARKIHLICVYWCFVLMSIHLGMHWGIILAIIKKLKINTMAFKIISLVIAIYGAYSFYDNGILSYMFLRNEFAFFDFEKSCALVIIQYLSMMGLWVFITHYGTKFISNKGE